MKDYKRVETFLQFYDTTVIYLATLTVTVAKYNMIGKSLQLTVIVAPLKVLIPNRLGRVNGLPRRVGPLPEIPQPEKELPSEIPKLIISLLAGFLGFSGHGPPVKPNNIGHILPHLPILLVVRPLVLLQLHLVHLVQNLLGARHELHHGTAAEPLHELRVLPHLLVRCVLAADENGVVVAAEGGVIVGEDLIDLRGVAVVREGLALPEDLPGQLLVGPGFGGLGGLGLGPAAEGVWEGDCGEVGREGGCVGEGVGEGREREGIRGF